MKKQIIQKLIAASVLAGAVATSQAALVEVWDYTVDVKWTSATFIEGSSPQHALKHTRFTESVLSWGYDRNLGGVDGQVFPYGAGSRQMRSSLIITQPKGTGSVATGSEASRVNVIQHTNNAILDTSTALSAATLNVSLNLTAQGGTAPAVSFNRDFEIYFWETPNNNGGCTWGTGTICNDDFLVFVAMPQINEIFAYDGINYAVSYQVTGSNAIRQFDAAVCSEVSRGALAGPCFGFQTPEHASAMFQFGLSVSAVPEPQTYAMLLAGLGMVGIIARRRRNMLGN